MSDCISEFESSAQHVFALLRKFGVTRLLTGQGETQTACALSIAHIDAAGVVWLVTTSIDPSASRALEAQPEVVLVCESNTVYLSVVGRARVVPEPWRLDRQLSAPDLTLIAVTPTAGEFKDYSYGDRCTYQFDAAPRALS
jgi:hypothetical protein